MSPRPGPEHLAAWRAFLGAHARLTERLDAERVREGGLPLGWYDVLVQLAEAPANSLRMHELANAVLLSRSGLSRLVDRICAAGLVERRPAPDDRRGTIVGMTPAGRAAFRRAAPAHLRSVQRHFAAHLDQAGAAQMRSAFERMLAALAAADDGAEAGPG